MPTRDQCEPRVVRALEKTGWVVTHQPFYVRVAPGELIYADLRLRQQEQVKAVIVLEVKCFADKHTLLDEFYRAVGQYIFYRNALELAKIDLPVYLSVPSNVHTNFFSRRTVQAGVQEAKIKLIIIDIEQEEGVRWTD
jgi:hypothetical protein